MRFFKDPYSRGSVAGKEKKIMHKLKLGIGMVGVYCIAVPLYSVDPLEIYHAAELKQRFYRRSPIMIVGFSGSLSEAELLCADILSDIFEKQGDYDSRRYFKCEDLNDSGLTDASEAGSFSFEDPETVPDPLNGGTNVPEADRTESHNEPVLSEEDKP